MVGDDGVDLAECARIKQLPDDVELWQELGPHCLHEEDALASGDLGQSAGLAGIERHRLLDQGVLAGLQRHQRARVVRIVRGGDVHHIDIRVGEQLLVRAIGPVDAVPAGEGGGSGQVPGSNRQDVLFGMTLQRPDEPLGDPARAHDAPAQRRRRHGVRRPGGWQGGWEGHRLAHFCCGR
jgi:hypothetical protein